MKQFLFCCFLFIQGILWSQSDTARFVIRTAGFYREEDGYDLVKDSIADKWGIRYLPVAGCISTTEFADSINRLNKITYKRLASHYGSDWEERYVQEVDVAYEKILHQKEHTFRETATCNTEAYSLKVSENLSQTRINFSVLPRKAGNQHNYEVRLLGLQNMDSTILYRGYENLVVLEFGSLSDTVRVSIQAKGKLMLHDSCATANQIRFKYRVPGLGKRDTLLVKTSGGQVQQFVFSSVSLNNPELYFNEVLLDSTLSLSSLNTTSVLSMHYDRTCLVPNRFTIHSWEIRSSGNKPYSGRGSIIPLSVIRKLKKLQPGTACSMMITISSADCILRKKIVHFTLI